MMSPRDRRTLAIGLVACASLVAIARGLPLWRSWLSESAAEAARLELAASFAESGTMNGRAAAESLTVRSARLLALDSALVDAESPSNAAAYLSTLVADVADQSAVKLGAVRLRVDTMRARGKFARVGVAANATGDIRGVIDLLVGLEEGFPAVAVRELTISQPEPGAATDRPEMLRVDFVIDALTRRRP